MTHPKAARSNPRLHTWQIPTHDIPIALSYDDVLLTPQRTTVTSRRTVDTSTWLSRNVRLNMPIVSANMDTVTESSMGIAMARQGGIGIIHRFLTVEAQAEEVHKVKRAEAFSSPNPTHLPRTKRWNEHGAPWSATTSRAGSSGRRGQAGGFLSSRDVRFVRNPDSTVGEVMTPRQKLITAPADVSLEEASEIFAQHKIQKLPLVRGRRRRGHDRSQGPRDLGDNPHAAKDKRGHLIVGAAIGVMHDALERSAALVDAGVDVLVVDVAHGHAQSVIDLVRD